MTGLPPVQRGTAMMFQSYALFPHRSVLDNVSFRAEDARRRQGERSAAARELLAKVHMERFANRLPARTVGRPAAAGGAGPGADHQPAGAAAG